MGEELPTFCQRESYFEITGLENQGLGYNGQQHRETVCLFVLFWILAEVGHTAILVSHLKYTVKFSFSDISLILIKI